LNANSTNLKLNLNQSIKDNRYPFQYIASIRLLFMY